MKYEIQGTIKIVFDTQTFNSGFQKREFVITTDDDKYPQDIKFQAVKERCELLDQCRPGDRVKLAFDIRGNEFKGRFYVDLVAFRIERAGGSPQQPRQDYAPRQYEPEDDPF